MRYLIAFIFLCTSLIAQQQITGIIFNKISGDPLSLANVRIQDSNVGSITDENGEFKISGKISAGDILVVSYIGFNTQKILLTKDNINFHFNIGLTPKVLSSQSVLVKASIGQEGFSPITFSKIKRTDIEDRYTVQDIPEFLSYMPSTTFYSEAGNGIGYNYLSIRGFDQRRISISINGIPQNEPEDHNIYWLDFPNLLESTELIQVQRGAGSGVIGYPAVGGSINIITSTHSDKRKFDLSASLGSYNTRKYTAAFSSGLIDNKYSVYAELGKILSSGYRNNSWVNFNSYHVSAVRFDKNVTTQLNFYGGPVADGLVYNGLPKFTIKNKELRKENLSYWESANGEYTYKAVRRPDEIENFSQPHFELLNEVKLSDNITFNNALFLILGDGFFDYDGSWADSSYFRLTSANGFHLTQNPSNVLIRAMVENKQWGIIPRMSLKHQNGELIFGLEYRNHRSVHWGSLQYGSHLPDGLTQSYRYYYYEGGKDIFNAFIHENYNLNSQINFLAEVQMAYHKYMIRNERYLDNKFQIDGLYLNPKVGVNYKFNPSLNSYLSFARVTREPRLKNYYDAAESSGGATPQFKKNSDGSYNFNEPLVHPETMNDIEIGTNYTTDKINLSLNAFYMLFKDEIVKSGQLDRFGQPITGNTDRTIHTGIEFSATARLTDFIYVTLNGSYSRSYIDNGISYLNYFNPQKDKSEIVAIDLSGNRISGFPDLTFNGIIKINLDNFETQIFAKYVGDFYSDNYDNKLDEYLKKYPGLIDYTDNKVDAYFVANIIASYEFDLLPAFQNVRIFGQINNIFDNLYAAYAVGKEFFPAAERNFLIGIRLGL